MVIGFLLPDPPTLVMAGEMLRNRAINTQLDWDEPVVDLRRVEFKSVTADGARFDPMMNNGPKPASWARTFDVKPRANACVAAQSGALTFVRANECMVPPLSAVFGATQMFSLSGITRDSAGAVLVSCEVWLLDTSGNHIDTQISDPVTGVYSFGYPSIGQSGGYAAIAWKTDDTLRGATARNLAAAAS